MQDENPGRIQGFDAQQIAEIVGDNAVVGSRLFQCIFEGQ
jgi:hypothetical protein